MILLNVLATFITINMITLNLNILTLRSKFASSVQNMESFGKLHMLIYRDKDVHIVTKVN